MALRGMASVAEPLRKLGALLRVPFHRRLAAGIAAVYLVLFLVALQDVTLSGSGFGFTVVEWTRMFDRATTVTFEPVARITLPGVTILLSPVNVLIGAVLAALVGLNLLGTWVAVKHPKACRFDRSTGVLASLPALLSGGACCAPAVILILGFQMSSALVTVFQILIPVSAVLLLVTLKLVLDRTEPELVPG